MEKTTSYPQYYRRAGTCVMVVSETLAKVVRLPPDVLTSQAFDYPVVINSTYPSAERLQEFLKELESCIKETFDDFYATHRSYERDRVSQYLRKLREMNAIYNSPEMSKQDL